MFVVRDCVHIKAPLERCFLLSTNLELVQRTLGMRALETGRTRSSANIGAGERVVWVGWKFGLPLVHESEITRYEPLGFFQDTMVRGRFTRFQHDHSFTEIDGHVLLTESVKFSLPLGLLRRFVGRRYVVPYITELVRERMTLLRQVAESSEWKRYLRQERDLDVVNMV